MTAGKVGVGVGGCVGMGERKRSKTVGLNLTVSFKQTAKPGRTANQRVSETRGANKTNRANRSGSNDRPQGVRR